MTGSGIGAETFGIGTEAVTCGDCAVKRSKFGKVKRSKLGKENFGKDNEKRSRLGKELAVAAPMTANADKDTTIAGIRLEAACCGASGGLSPCVSLSGVSATCVPLRVSPIARFLLAADQQHKKRAVAWTIRRRLSRDCPTQIRLKSWAYMVNDQLLSALSRVSRSAAGLPAPLLLMPEVQTTCSTGCMSMAKVSRNFDVMM
jgi:hypothetical protein